MSNSIRSSLYKTFQDNSQLQPSLRVDSGAAALSLPTGCTPEGIVVELPLAEEITLSPTISQQPQHQRTAEAEWTFFTGWRAKW